MSTRFLFTLLSVVLLLTGYPGDAFADPGQRERTVVSQDAEDAGQVTFPAAAGIRSAKKMGPEAYPALAGGLLANDLVAYDSRYGGSTPTIFYLPVRGGGTGAPQSVLASSSVGSGYAFSGNLNANAELAVSPAGFVYYATTRTAGGVGYIDFVEVNPVTLVRRVISAGDNTALGTALNSTSSLCWDFSTGTLLYADNGASTTAPARGIYRLNPVTGVRTPVSLYGGNPGSGVTIGTANYLSTDPFGNIFYLDYEPGTGQLHYVVQIPVLTDSSATYGARTLVSSNATTYAGYNTAKFNYLRTIAFDHSQGLTLNGTTGLPTNEALVITDEGDDTSSSDIYRVPVATGAHSQIITSATNTNQSVVFDLPESATPDTTGRIYYAEVRNINANNNTLNAIAAGTRANTILSGVQNLSSVLNVLRLVPPPTPMLATPTTSNLGGTTATFNGNTTADGGVANSGVFQRGFVYSQTGTNGTPRIGGTGVTQVTNLVVLSLPVAQNGNLGAFSSNVSGLTSGVTYTFSAYSRNISGYTYSTPATFTTAVAPSVTTVSASDLTGVSATLNGNVTADGGASLTTRGFVYSSTSTAPAIGGTGVTNLPASGTATGAYSASATGLTNGTAYYFRAYATNSVGTTYGVVQSFRTIAPPTANSQSVTVAFSTATAITLTGSDPNSPAQTLTYSIVSQPTKGTLSGTAPNLTYTPTAGANGSDSFTFRATNTAGLTSNTATVSITIAAGTPTANSQSVSIAFNTATAIILTASDPDQPPLALTYTVVTAPTRGTLSGTAPNLTYTPTANTQGADSFTFRVSNGTNQSNVATVSITVAAGTPNANSQSVATGFNTARAITLTGSDPNSPALTLTYTITTAPTRGTLSGTAPNLTYTPSANTQGSDSFTFTVSNGQRTSSPATVSITVAAGTPTANSQSVNVNLNLPRSITLNGTDPNSPALSLTYTVVKTPLNGILSGTAPNLTYTPNAGYVGSDDFTFTVSNGQQTSNAAAVNLTVIGQPTISTFTPNSGTAGTLVTITGSNLQNAMGVNFFRNQAGMSFTVVSATQVTVRVPAGAATGTLTLLSGSGSNSSSTKFVVTAVP